MKTIIYGINQQAQQLFYFMHNENAGEIVAFTVDRAYYQGSQLLGRPVVCFEDIETIYSPTQYDIVLSFGYKNMVHNRRKKFIACQEKGYCIRNFVSKDAKVYAEQIGIGVIIYPNVVVEPYVKIGDGNFLESSCTIAHHSRIGNFNFFAPGVTIGGDVTINNHCFFGLSSIIASGKIIGDNTMIGAGVCVTKDIMGGVALRHNEAITLSRKPEYYI